MSKILISNIVILLIVRSKSLSCNDAYECEDNGENEDNIYCSGHQSCSQGTLEISDTLECSGSSSCVNAAIMPSERTSEVDCSGFESCNAADLDYDSLGSITCSGYSSCIKSSIYIEGNVFCSGYESCIEATRIKTNAISGGDIDSHSIICDGLKSCYKVDPIEGNDAEIRCNGFQSCAESTIDNAELGLYCDGEESCFDANIQGVSLIIAGGDHALHDAEISTTDAPSTTLDIQLNGKNSGKNLDINCYSGYKCHVSCNSDQACNGVVMNCYDVDACTYDTNCTDTDSACNIGSYDCPEINDYSTTLNKITSEKSQLINNRKLLEIEDYNNTDIVLLHGVAVCLLFLGLICGLINCYIIIKNKYNINKNKNNNINNNEYSDYGSVEFNSLLLKSNSQKNKFKLNKFGLIIGLIIILFSLILLILLPSSTLLSSSSISYISENNINSDGNCGEEEICDESKLSYWYYLACTRDVMWGIDDTCKTLYGDSSCEDDDCGDGYDCCWKTSIHISWPKYYCDCERYKTFEPTSSPTLPIPTTSPTMPTNLPTPSPTLIITCEDENECESDTSLIGTTIYCQGLNSCYNSEITATDAIYCQGEESCSRNSRSSSLICENNIYCDAKSSCKSQDINSNNIYCQGISSCERSTLTLTNDLFCYGGSSCSSSTIEIEGILNCYGEISCSKATININDNTIIYGEGELSLQDATINGNGYKVEIYLRGSQSGNGLTVNCDTGDCDIICETADACDNTEYDGNGVDFECIGEGASDYSCEYKCPTEI